MARVLPEVWSALVGCVWTALLVSFGFHAWSAPVGVLLGILIILVLPESEGFRK